MFSSGTANVANDPTLNAQTGALTASANGTALNTFDRYGRTLYTHPGGQTDDGSISINVTNLEYVLEIGTLSNENSSYWDSTGLGTPAQNINLGNVESDQPQGVLGSNGINSDGFIESIMAVSVGQFTAAIERLAAVRAENGAEQNRAMQVTDMLQSSLTNLEAAHGRIMDADIALESTRFARHNVLVQAGAAMTAQANQLTNVALSLIG